MALKTDYVNDVLDTSKNTNRKYEMTENTDGTVSLTDVTVYSQEGSLLGANDINATNTVVNGLFASDGLQFKFATDGEGNYGYLGADDSFNPFKSIPTFYNKVEAINEKTPHNLDMALEKGVYITISVCSWGYYYSQSEAYNVSVIDGEITELAKSIEVATNRYGSNVTFVNLVTIDGNSGTVRFYTAPHQQQPMFKSLIALKVM